MTYSTMTALRGAPSYVWRDGQERRLQMIAKWARLDDASVLIDGCGLGMYAHQIQQRFTPHVEALDIEFDRVLEASTNVRHAIVAASERLPYPDDTFDSILSHEVLEHVNDDRLSVHEMVRVLKPEGRIVVFVPNRWYPFETHGHYWHGNYHFGNTPLINYLPDVFRNRLAPHVRAYTGQHIQSLFHGLPIKIITHRRIYGGYDNIIARLGTPGRLLRGTLYFAEKTPLSFFGLSHLVVVEKTD